MRISDWSSDVCSSDLLCALSRRPSRTPDSFFPEQRPWRGPSERMNLSRTLSTSVIALALSVPLVLMARSGDGLPATSRVDQATTSKLVYGLLSDSRSAYRPLPLDGTLSADLFERYLDSLDGRKMFFIAPDIAPRSEAHRLGKEWVKK